LLRVAELGELLGVLRFGSRADIKA